MEKERWVTIRNAKREDTRTTSLKTLRQIINNKSRKPARDVWENEGVKGKLKEDMESTEKLK